MAPDWASDKTILLGITGGIAAYKTPELVRAIKGAGMDVEIILTDAAATLVSALALSTVAHRRVWRDADLLSDERGWTIPHISLTDAADAFVVAPCTANTLAAAVCGRSDTLLGAAMLAWQRPIIFFPAMNEHMLTNAATQDNIATLRRRGHIVVDPDAGELACGISGRGRLPATDEMMDVILAALCPRRDLDGVRVLITAGPTHEYIDPVRFISNPSSGKMGRALAACALMRGASVDLVLGPSNVKPPTGASVTRVVSAVEMRDACMALLPQADIIIKAAAVGDFRAAAPADRKIKRGDARTMTIELAANPDIAREIGEAKRPSQVLVGFAAETNDVEANARRKIETKGLDLIAANDVLRCDAGFATDTNSILLVDAKRHGGAMTRHSGTKFDVADAVLDRAAEILRAVR